MEITVINGRRNASLDVFAIDEIVGENEATSGAGPPTLVEKEITEAIINWLVIIKFENLGLVGRSANDDVGTEVADFVK